MFEQVKQILTEEYTKSISHYDELKAQIDSLENKMKEDNSEEDYKNQINELNKKYNIFKRGKEYKDKLIIIKQDYMKKLKDFENTYNEFLNLKSEASKINIYQIQKKLEQLANASELKDIKMTEDEAQKIINEKLATF